MVQDDDAPAEPADAPHFARDANRIGNDTDHVRGVDDVEGVVGEFEVGRIHLQQADVSHAFPEHTVARFFQHRARQIDAGHQTVRGIERRIDPGADTDFQHPLAGFDAHALDRVHTTRVQRRSEREVVD